MADDNQRPTSDDTPIAKTLTRSTPAPSDDSDDQNRTPIRNLVRDLATGGATGVVRGAYRQMRKRRGTRE